MHNLPPGRLDSTLLYGDIGRISRRPRFVILRSSTWTFTDAEVVVADTQHVVADNSLSLRPPHYCEPTNHKNTAEVVQCKESKMHHNGKNGRKLKAFP